MASRTRSNRSSTGELPTCVASRVRHVRSDRAFDHIAHERAHEVCEVLARPDPALGDTDTPRILRIVEMQYRYSGGEQKRVPLQLAPGAKR